MPSKKKPVIKPVKAYMAFSKSGKPVEWPGSDRGSFAIHFKRSAIEECLESEYDLCDCKKQNIRRVLITVID